MSILGTARRRTPRANAERESCDVNQRTDLASHFMEERAELIWKSIK